MSGLAAEHACLQQRFRTASACSPWAAVAVLAPAVRRHVSRHFPRALRGGQDPEDLAQDVLVRLHRAVARGALHDGGGVAGYVARACRNACRDAWRRHCLEQARLRECAGGAAAGPAADPVICAEDTARLHSALGTLSAQEQLVVRARLAGESFRAIGARIGVTSDAPRKLLPRIVARLRALLADPRLGRAIAVVDPAGWPDAP